MGICRIQLGRMSDEKRLHAPEPKSQRTHRHPLVWVGGSSQRAPAWMGCDLKRGYVLLSTVTEGGSYISAGSHAARIDVSTSPSCGSCMRMASVLRSYNVVRSGFARDHFEKTLL